LAQLTPRFVIINLVQLRQLIVNSSSKNQLLWIRDQNCVLMQFNMAMHEQSLVQFDDEQCMIHNRIK